VNARRVTLETPGSTRTILLHPGERRTLLIPVSGSQTPLLTITSDQANALDAGGPDTRLVALRIPHLSYVQEGPN
jgi:hypothetical protein